MDVIDSKSYLIKITHYSMKIRGCTLILTKLY